jgi:hypothetical protein
MADFDTNYWGGGAYTPTDYSMQSAAPNWAPTQMDYAPNVNYQQPNYYDQYAGYAPDWGSQGGGYDSGWGGFSGDVSSMQMPESSGGLGSILGGIGDWMKQPAGAAAAGGGETNGSKLLSAGITGLGGAALGLMQSKALEKANKKKAKADAERIKNAGKVAAQQRLDYLDGMRQDPRFREFTVNAPDRVVTGNASGAGGKYGQTGGEHQFFDPEYLSKITTTPVPLAEGGLASLALRQQAKVEEPDLMGFVRYIMNGKKLPSETAPPQEHAISTYASGGGNARQQALDEAMGYAGGGLSRMVTGKGGGQDDMVDARLSPGEYVMDAETVSALGDGSSEAGAKKLDKMRQNVRTHKRAAPKTKIPPKAKKPEGYL